MIKLDNLNKSYKDKSNQSFSLKNINLSILDNSLTFILGESGSGKTTLLNLIGGLDRLDSGSIFFNNLNISKLSNSELDSYRNSVVGYVYQDFKLFEELTIKENLNLVFDLQNKQIDNEKINDVLNFVGLKEILDHKVCDLSGGQKQRVSIARCLLKDSKILLCDEPTGALDSENAKQIFEMLKLLSEKMTIIVVSHDVDFANNYADRIIKISDGIIENDDALKEQKENNAQLKLSKNKNRIKSAFKFAFKAMKKRVGILIGALVASFLIFSLIGFQDSLYVKDESKSFALEVLKLNKKYVYSNKISSYLDQNENEIKINENFDSKDIEFLKQNFERSQFIVEHNNKFDNFSPNYVLPIVEGREKRNPYFLDSINGYIEFENAEVLNDFGFMLECGEYPSNDNEVVITNYRFDCFNMFGYKNGDISINKPTKSDLIGKTITLTTSESDENISFKIVGICNTNFVSNVKEKSETYSKFTKNSNEIKNILEESLDNVLIVNKGFNFSEVPGLEAEKTHKRIFISLPETIEENKLFYNIFKSNLERSDSPVLIEGLTYLATNYKVNDPLIDSISNAKANVDAIRLVLFVAPYCFIVFAILLLFVYFGGLINCSQNDIGILKSLGFSNKYVCTIFTIISLVIFVFIVLTSFLGSQIMLGLTNLLICSIQKLNIGILTYNPLGILKIFVFAFLGIVCGLIIPLMILVRKKPVCLLKGN